MYRLALILGLLAGLVAVPPDQTAAQSKKTEAKDQSVAGRWKGYFRQVPGGLINPGNYFADATLKQDKDGIKGEIQIAMEVKPDCYHRMTTKGKLEKGIVVLKDDKVIESKRVTSRWFTDRTFKGQVSEFGSITGTWADPSDASGKGTFALIRMDYSILMKRGRVNELGLIPNKLYLNGTLLGEVFENPKHLIPAGEYKGRRRITSGKNFVQGPRGVMGKRGDFLLEVVGVPKRSDILIHPGNKPEHSEGCILAGPVTTKGKLILAPPILAALRLHFYGTDAPQFADPVYTEKEKGVVIKVEDYKDDKGPFTLRSEKP